MDDSDDKTVQIESTGATESSDIEGPPPSTPEKNLLIPRLITLALVVAIAVFVFLIIRKLR